MAYLDNIIIYLNSEQEHKEYIKQVLKKLYKKAKKAIGYILKSYYKYKKL